MIGATPWKQQVMQSVGVAVSGVVLPLILELLFKAYGIGDIFPRAGMNPTNALSAPQSQLMSAIVRGVLGR